MKRFLALILVLVLLPAIPVMAADGYVEVIAPKYDSLGMFSEGLATVKVGDKWGFIDTSGKEVIPMIYDDCNGFCEGLAAVKLDGKWGYVDKTGSVVIDMQYDLADNFRRGRAVVSLKNRFGFIDTDGNEVIPLQYNGAIPFYSDLAAVEKGSKWGFIDESGNMVVEPKYDAAMAFRDGCDLAAVKKDGKAGFIDKAGNEVIPLIYEDYYGYIPSEGLTMIKQGDLFGYADEAGNIVVQPQYKSANAHHEGLASVKKDGKWGYIDKQGNVVIPLQYEWTDQFSEGFAWVYDGEKYGVIDKSGNLVVPFKYEYLIEFHNGYARIKENGLYGFIDRTGEVVIPPSFENTGNVSSEGYVQIMKDGKWGYIRIGDAAAPAQPEAPASVGGFTDVLGTDYFAEAVAWALEKKVTQGTSATTFSPDSTVTRGQAVTFLWRAMGQPEPQTAENPFTDVAEGDYFYKPVLWAVQQGVTAGTSATTFSPANTCTNAHILTFMYRCAGEPGKTGAGAWYDDAMNWARAGGKLEQAGDIFDPNADCPRRDVVYFLWLNAK